MHVIWFLRVLGSNVSCDGPEDWLAEVVNDALGPLGAELWQRYISVHKPEAEVSRLLETLSSELNTPFSAVAMRKGDVLNCGNES